jgi:transposase
MTDRRCAAGEETRAVGVQELPDRRARARGAVVLGSGAGDLAADPEIRRERELARFRLHLVRLRTSLKNRIHSTLIAFGKSCPMSDLFGVAGRELLDSLAVPEPWRGNVDASQLLIDEIDR